MGTLNDVFEFTEGELPDFTHNQPLPDQDSTVDFARTATLLVEAGPSTVDQPSPEGIKRQWSGFRFPEGLLEVSLSFSDDPDFGRDTPEGVKVSMLVAMEAGSLAVGREIEVSQNYSAKQKHLRKVSTLRMQHWGPGAEDEKIYMVKPYEGYPRIIDKGIVKIPDYFLDYQSEIEGEIQGTIFDHLGPDYGLDGILAQNDSYSAQLGESSGRDIANHTRYLREVVGGSKETEISERSLNQLSHFMGSLVGVFVG